MSTIEEKVLNLKQPAQMYYNQQMKAANENIFTAIKTLRKGFADDSIEPEYREAAGMAALPGSAGEFMWAGWAGTFFWIEPKTRLVGILMSQGQGLRSHYRRLIKQLVDQAIVD